eukprot:2769725-Prymnesium_polylepis.1
MAWSVCARVAALAGAPRRAAPAFWHAVWTPVSHTGVNIEHCGSLRYSAHVRVPVSVTPGSPGRPRADVSCKVTWKRPLQPTPRANGTLARVATLHHAIYVHP